MKRLTASGSFGRLLEQNSGCDQQQAGQDEIDLSAKHGPPRKAVTSDGAVNGNSIFRSMAALRCNRHVA
jgi:hypothetical protein